VKLKVIVAMMIVSAGLVSCDIEKKMIEAEEGLIRDYIQQNSITVQPTASGLYYIETLAGAGENPDDGDIVGVYYTLWFLTGEKLAELIEGEPFEFTIGEDQVIAGFEEGIRLMKHGGKAKLVIPSKLAYGRTGDPWGIIPGYTPLLYEVELKTLSVGPGK